MMMPLQLSSEKMTLVTQERLRVEELQIALGDIRDVSIFTTDSLRPTESCKRQVEQSYWFRCPICNFDWREWIRPSITFVSMLFITNTCPNCRRKHVVAYQRGLNCRIGVRQDLAAGSCASNLRGDWPADDLPRSAEGAECQPSR
jgi:hypothetical protein